MSLLSAFRSIPCTWSHGFLLLMGYAAGLALGFGTEQDACPFLQPPESALLAGRPQESSSTRGPAPGPARPHMPALVTASQSQV